MTKLHAEFPNFMQNLDKFGIPKLGILGGVKI